mgnify:CR=1 FL=1
MNRKEFYKYFADKGIQDGNKITIKIGDLQRLADRLDLRETKWKMTNIF